ncbi:MAG TPA: hypothetical protein VE912_24955 [Bacteroidales bacterium]|nr:hypothetical protein [Bacteroidales bacterium]
MKKTVIIASFLLLTLMSIQAQEVTGKLDEAKTAYNSGELDNTRFALQQALAEIDQVIGKEILGMLPATMGDLPAVTTEDNVTGSSSGFAGLYVNRSYQGTEKSASIEIVSDSPLLAGLNSLLAMPMLMGSDPNQKRIKINGYKGLLQKNTDDTGKVSWDVQLPFNQSLLTFNCDGFENESDVVAMANTIPIDKIVKISK